MRIETIAQYPEFNLWIYIAIMMIVAIVLWNDMQNPK